MCSSRSARSRRLGRSAVAGLLLAVGALTIAVALGVGHHGSRRLAPGGGGANGTFDPLAYSSMREGALQAAAAAGMSHVIYAKSPGGVSAAAGRTAKFRGSIDVAGRGAPIDADTLEAIVMLESGGRKDVVAGSDPSAAAGLTQIVASTGSALLQLRVDLPASRRLGRQILAARAAGRRGQAAKLAALRSRVDQRFDPAAALGATERYLAIARQRFGRDDLAVESYHMGIGNLETALRLYAGDQTREPIAKLVRRDELSYARLFFDSTPIHHAAAYAWLSRLGDDSATYLWRVEAAKQIMRLFRAAPAELTRLGALHGRGPSAEHVLRPLATTPSFRTPAAVSAARAGRTLVALPSGPSTGLRPNGPLLLRPVAQSTIQYAAAGTQQISHSQASLQVTAAVTDGASLRGVARASHGLADPDPLHATGYAFDIARRYASPAQANAFQFMLNRLQVLNRIAWQRHGRIIHVVVGAGVSP